MSFINLNLKGAGQRFVNGDASFIELFEAANAAFDECKKETDAVTLKNHAKALREFMDALEIVGDGRFTSSDIDALHDYRGALSKIIISSNVIEF
jgi:hypothetical protein